jgi:hypothetical protein
MEKRRLRVFVKRMLRRIFGHKKDDLTGEWRKHSEEFYDLYFSPIIVRVIKSRRMRWAWHVARMAERRGVYFSPIIVRVIKSRRMRWAGHVARMGERRGVCRFLVVKPWIRLDKSLRRVVYQTGILIHCDYQ